MKKRLLPLCAIFAFLTNADAESVFPSLFDTVIENRLFTMFLDDGPGNWGFQLDTDSMKPEIQAVVAMSNHVDEAVAMIPIVLTNNLQREVFFNMTGYAGTNAFFQVWDGLLDIAETNATLCPPAVIERFWDAPTTPLEAYPIFCYDLPIAQELLTRTRNLFPIRSPRRRYFDNVISGREKSHMQRYLIESGHTLPPFASRDH